MKYWFCADVKLRVLWFVKFSYNWDEGLAQNWDKNFVCNSCETHRGNISSVPISPVYLIVIFSEKELGLTSIKRNSLAGHNQCCSKSLRLGIRCIFLVYLSVCRRPKISAECLNWWVFVIPCFIKNVRFFNYWVNHSFVVQLGFDATRVILEIREWNLHLMSAMILSVDIQL